jgi:glutaredoxin-like YruB-family protein
MAKTTTTQPRVLLFTTPSCSHCTRAKRYFKRNGIKFKEIDITRNPDGARDVKRISGGSSVPVIMVGHRAVVGFDPSKLDKMLGISNRTTVENPEND